MFGMVEPEIAGDIVANYILETISKQIIGKYYNRKGEKLPKKVILDGNNEFTNEFIGK